MLIGALPSEILAFVDQHHDRIRADLLYGLRHEGPNSKDDGLSSKVDRPYQEQVWRWLTRHPEISVGHDGEGNRMSLSDVEAHNMLAQQENAQGSDVMECAPDVTPDASNHTVDLSTPNQELYLNRNSQSGWSKPSKPDAVILTKATSRCVSTLRVYTSQDRMWYAAAGHGPDLERIPGLEFVCLSIIAAHRENGIFQPDLVRITGQDKRSVPLRTQNLHDKGYIEKRNVLFSGNRTSLCTLKRFAHQAVLPQSIFAYIEAPLRRVFDVLRDVKIMTWDDLKKSVVWIFVTFIDKTKACTNRLSRVCGGNSNHRGCLLEQYAGLRL